MVVLSPDIRERFLHYFEARGHHRMPSASLIPHDDPSLLFNVAGMVPLKPYFLGQRTPPAPRAASCQKCFRTVDIDEVGRSPRHVTFFEMLGNFSFGDYFKETAVPLAWEMLTREYSLPPDRLWPTVHPDDAVARDLWASVGVPRDRIGSLEENFWPAGAPVPGPCGFDSEIYWDRRVPCSCRRPDCLPGCDGDRWVEIWNLVFMEFDRDVAGQLHPLPRPSIDTGMGMERIAAVLQDRSTIFDTDLFTPIVEALGRRCRQDPPEESRLVSLRICADHLRAAVFLLADGVQPGNEGRGYVLRWVIRRAGVHGRRLGLEGGLAPDVGIVVGVMGPGYPELEERREIVARTLRSEEEAFAATLEGGAARLDALLAGGSMAVSGEDAFRLHDTFGFPIELTTEMASERGAVVDLAGFEAAMTAQRERSRAAQQQVVFEAGEAAPATTFVGYDRLEADTTVLRVLRDSGSAGPAAGGERVPGSRPPGGLPMADPAAEPDLDALGPGEEGAVILGESPFYAEAGGQVGDTGELIWEGGSARVLDTQPLAGGESRIHRVEVTSGRLTAGAVVLGRVDARRRGRVARHHSATHLLHRSLREVLGESAVQRGSYVGPDHTTFDFSFDRPLTSDEIRDVEHRVNTAIRDNLGRDVQLLPIAEARAAGAVALFGEKYGDTVRVVDFGGWARELCGGTHVGRSGDIGAAIIIGDSSIGRGLRRIEMVVGEAAEERWLVTEAALGETARSLRARPEDVPARVERLQTQLRELDRELQQARRSGGTGPAMAGAEVEELDGLRFAHLRVDEGSDGSAVSGAADRLFAERLGADGVAVVIGSRSLAVKVGGRALEAGVSAGDLARTGSELTGARGGGRAAFARGGVGDPAKGGDALSAIRERLRQDVHRANGGGATGREQAAGSGEGA